MVRFVCVIQATLASPGTSGNISRVVLGPGSALRFGRDDKTRIPFHTVIPAKAGICPGPRYGDLPMLGRIPAYAGMTAGEDTERTAADQLRTIKA